MKLHMSVLIIIILIPGCRNKTNNQTNTTLEEHFSEKPDSAFIVDFIRNNPIFSPFRDKILRFYKSRDYNLAWSKNGDFVPQVDRFVNVIEQIEDYGITKDTSLSQNVRDSILFLKDSPKPWNKNMIILQKKVDLILTADYFHVAPKLFEGTIDPVSEDSIQWFIEPKKIRYTQLLDSILYGKSVANPFINNSILHLQLAKLKKILQKYRDIQQNGGWPKIDNNVRKISLGDTGKAVHLLSKRLMITNDLPASNVQSSVFDSKLELGLKRFQKRHGLKVNGIADSLTLIYLNIPVEKKLKQILLNMERWRWVPKPIEKNYILVNIPDYILTVYKNESPVESMKIIAGKTGSNTVIFQGRIKYVVVNPYWNIPKSISIEEILPNIKKDTGYLRKNQIEVGRHWNFNAVQQDTINWENVNDENFDYTFRQRPGDENPLGRIKFLFPNQFSIYLHDTPNYKLFSETERGFSHGCIRVEKPLALADFLLRNNAFEKRKKIYNNLVSGKNESITIDTPVPVYIMYFTVWVDQNGIPQFRNDIYGHDKKLAEILFQ